jgi:hypothetical protein
MSTGYPAPGILTAPWKLTAKFPQIKQGWTDFKNPGGKNFLFTICNHRSTAGKIGRKAHSRIGKTHPPQREWRW